MGGCLNLNRLRKKEANQLKQQLMTNYVKSTEFVKACDEVVLAREEGVEIVVLDGMPAFARYEDTYIPTLLLLKLEVRDLLPKVVVDEGAVKHLINGADVMAPGIKELEEFNKDEMVSVWEPRKEAPLVVGRALLDSKTIKEVRKGKAVKTIHHVGDEIWNLALKIYSRQTAK